MWQALADHSHSIPATFAKDQVKGEQVPSLQPMDCIAGIPRN